MSDDLISRRKAIENLHKIPKIWNGNECLVSFRTVIDYMDSQATAYDVDKVVEQLEKLIRVEYEKPENCDENGIEDGEEIYEDGRTQGKYEAYKKALEIVKSGGVSDD